jgi:hypothetical protein
LCIPTEWPSAVICAIVTVEASEAVIFLADGGFSALIGCDFRAESREAVAALAAPKRPATLRGAVFRLDLEAALAGRLFFTERLFMEQL